MSTNRRMLTRKDLREIKGIPYSRWQLNRLIEARKFPAPVELSPQTKLWLEDEVDRYLEGLVVARDEKAAKASSNEAAQPQSAVAA